MTVLLIIGKVILKIIEILLILLLFAVIITGAVLFIPVRYSLDVSLYEEKNIHGRISWLFRTVNVPISYIDGKVDYSIKIFGADFDKIMEIFRGIGKKRTLKVSDKDKKTKNTDKHYIENNDIQIAESIEEKTKSNEKTPYKDYIVNADEKTVKKEKIQDATKDKKERKHRKKSGIKKISVDKIMYKVKSFFKFIKMLLFKADLLKKFLKSQELSGMVCLAKDNVLNLLIKLKPSVLKGSVKVGTGDPCSTGQLLGIISVAWGFSGFDVDIEPDFEEKVLEGNVKVKGCTRIFTLLSVLIKIMVSDERKQFQSLVNRTKKDMKIKEEI